MGEVALKAMIKHRNLLNKQIETRQEKLKKVNEQIIEEMDKMGIESFETRTHNIVSTQNTYTNYNWDSLNKLFTKVLSASDKAKLVTTTVTYKMNENVLMKYIKDGKLKTSQIRRRLTQTQSKKFVRVTAKKKGK